MKKLVYVVLAAGVALVSCQTLGIPIGPPAPPNIVVGDQEIEDGTIVVRRVDSDVPGWIVVHADKDGAPGRVIGYAPVKAGLSRNVSVSVDTGAATDTLHVMLHYDEGTEGTYEYPGSDEPVKMEGKPLTKSFSTVPEE